MLNPEEVEKLNQRYQYVVARMDRIRSLYRDWGMEVTLHPCNTSRVTTLSQQLGLELQLLNQHAGNLAWLVDDINKFQPARMEIAVPVTTKPLIFCEVPSLSAMAEAVGEAD